MVEEEEDNLYPLEEVRLEDSCHLEVVVSGNLNPLEEVESEGQYQRVEGVSRDLYPLREVELEGQHQRAEVAEVGLYYQALFQTFLRSCWSTNLLPLPLQYSRLESVADLL